MTSTSALAAHAYIYNLIKTEYAGSDYDVHFGLNVEMEGFKFIEVFGITWDEYEYVSNGQRGDSPQDEEFRIQIGITSSTSDGTLQDVFDDVVSVYQNIDRLVKADVTLGEALNKMAMCRPLEHLQGYDAQKRQASLVLDIVCKNQIVA